MAELRRVPHANYERHRERDMIFSLRDGFVWASWPDTDATVRLGRHDKVAAMMRDFLAQDALSERLGERNLGAPSRE
jgi:hypothetical protein